MSFNILALKFNYDRLYYISPVGLSVISFIICTVAFLFPPQLYQDIVHEPNRMFLNLNMLLFYVFSLVSLLFGYFSSGKFLVIKPCIVKSSQKYLPLLIFCVGVAFSVFYVEFKYNEMLLMGGSKAYVIKENFHVPPGVNALTFILIGFVWWSVWQWPVKGKLVTKLLIVLLAIFVMGTGIIKISRGEVIPLLFGIVVSILGVKASRNLNRNKKMRKMHIIVFVLFLGGVFIIFSIIRGSNGFMGLSNDVIGYSLSSFNRLASVLDGSLVYPDAGKGIYLFNFIGYNNTINNLFGTREFLGWPSFNTYWRGEFGAVRNAGLNGSLIWATAPGYVFSELGYASFIYWYLIGFLYRFAWVEFCNQKTFGIIIYPWLAFCLFFWFGTNYVVDTRLVALIFSAFILLLYNKTTRAFKSRKLILESPIPDQYNPRL